jgi:hypothetical protein
MIKIPTSELVGFDRWLKGQSDELRQECKVVIADITHEFVTNAKHKVNVYKKQSGKGGPTGRLMSAIRPKFSKDGLSAQIVADTDYAAYQEFGTGDLVEIEPGFEDVAIEFKGKGIRKVNVPPKSYFFSNFERANKRLFNELHKMGFR